MAEVIIIYPKVDEGDSGFCIMPLSVLYVATPLDRKGYRVRILDQRTEPCWQEELRRELREEKPLCVGVSSMTGYQLKGAIEASRIVRKEAPGVPIVWGGVHPSLMPAQTLESGYADIVVIGEGEVTFSELVEALGSGKALTSVKGIAFAEDGRVFSTGSREFLDLDELPRLSYHLLDVKQYISTPLGSPAPSLPILTSRGCPYRCTYCYNRAFNRRRWRAMRPERVVDEIEYLAKSFRVPAVFLDDDEFFIDQERVRAICELLLQHNLGVALHNVNCRVEHIARYDMDFLRLLRKAGVEVIYLGVESGSDAMLKVMKKDTTAEMVPLAHKKLVEAGIIPYYGFMAGLPGETAADLRASLRLICRLMESGHRMLFYGFSLYTPFPGTELYDMLVARKAPLPATLEEWSEYDFVRLNYSHGFDERYLDFLLKATIISRTLDPRNFSPRSWWRKLVVRLYSATLHLRVRCGFYALMPEVRYLIKRWRLT